tara:strand:- start:35 stop:694 length:660 start_codon:yes stop_codon:yes gene_type:complete
MPRIIKSAKGTFTTADITIDSDGRVVTASSGAGGDGSYVPRIVAVGPASGNYDSPANASKFYAYAFAGGGGGGAGSNTNPGCEGGDGGKGAAGFYSGSVSGNTTYAYSVGAGGSGGPGSQNHFGVSGQTGGDTSVTNLFTAGGGTAGPGSGNSPGVRPDASDTPASNATFSIPRGMYMSNQNTDGLGLNGTGGANGPSSTRAGNSGTPGLLHYFDDGGQ